MDKKLIFWCIPVVFQNVTMLQFASRAHVLCVHSARSASPRLVAVVPVFLCHSRLPRHSRESGNPVKIRDD